MIELIQTRLVRALNMPASSKAIRTHSGVALGTSIGLVRKRNEDCCLIAKLGHSNVNRSNFTVALVCDGLGGMSQGREASTLAAGAFVSSLFCDKGGELRERLDRAVSYANAEVFQKLRGEGGTTLSAVVVSRMYGVTFCHVGDSRIYGVMPDRSVKQLSRDDTINGALNRRDNGDDVPKDSRLLQFVGMGDEMEPQIAFVPNECTSVLLTSDGAHDVPHSVFQRVISAAVGGSDLIRKLFSLSEMLGGRDNASAILLPIGGEADMYEEVSDNELLAILPNDSVSIYYVEPVIRQETQKSQSSAGAISAAQSVDAVEKAILRAAGVDAGRSKPPAVKEKKPARSTKAPKKSKRQSAPQLPLDTPAKEVGLKFSSSTADEKGE